MKKIRWVAGMALVVFFGQACATEEQPTTRVASESSGLTWSCGAWEGAARCETDLESADLAHEEFVCDSSADANECPSVDELGVGTWACLRHDAHVACARPLDAGDVVPGSPAPGDETGSGTPPTVPESCGVAEWKEFFCSLVELELSEHGIAYEMDCAQLPDTLQPAFGGGSLDEGPSCNTVVDEIELKSWMYGVETGCAEPLVLEITTWCANSRPYLAHEGVCVY